MLLGWYLVYPSFALNDACIMLGVDFTSLCMTSSSMLFHSSCSVFQRSSLLVGRSLCLWSRKRRSDSCWGVMDSMAVVIAWSLNHLIVDIVICFGLLSYWTTHSSGFLFVIITIILTSQPTCSGCHVRCFDNACCSFSLWLWSAPQPPPNSCNPKPWCSLSHASRSY